MKTIEQVSEISGEAESKAARFLIAQDDRDYTESQRAELRRWIMQSDEHCDAYLRLVRAWRRSLTLNKKGDGSGSKKPNPAQRPRISKLHALFGNVVRKRREQLGWSIEELAEKAWMEPEDIEGFETGRQHLRLECVLVLARAMEMASSRLTMQLERALSELSRKIIARKPKIAQAMAAAGEKTRVARLRANKTKH